MQTFIKILYEFLNNTITSQGSLFRESNLEMPATIGGS